MNNLNLTIKFIFEHSTQEISFLGMKIYVRTDHKLSTTLYRKPTDCATLLPFHSNHSFKCKESIAFSLALSYNFLIADDTVLQKELDFLKHLSSPDNTLQKSSLVTSPKLSSNPIIPFSTDPPGHQVPEQPSQS